MMNKHKTRIAAIGDLHVRESSGGTYKKLFNQISQEADIALLCGDLTNRGLVSEAEVLAEELESFTIPVLGVLGNHDFESQKYDEVIHILKKSKIELLDGTSYVHNNVGFAGVKGFCGGFNGQMLEPWGEIITKQFVFESINEALKLETALSDLDTEKKVVVLHYSPITDTLEGEKFERYPFLGSSRFEKTIDSFYVQAAFHGHVHKGKHAGKTCKGTPVFNVALPVMQKINPEKSYLLIEM